MSDSEARPETIDKLLWDAPLGLALLAGMQLDVFTPLRDGPMSAEEIAAAIGVGPSKLRALLYVLVVGGLLTVDGGLFSNAPEADRFLVRGRPSFIGGRHVQMTPLCAAVLKTAETISTGTPRAKPDWSAASEEAAALRSYPQTKARARVLMERHDFSSYRTLLDVGGGSGGLSIALTEAHPNLKATVVELARVTPVTERIVGEDGAAERVRVLSADMVSDPLKGSFDVAILSDFIQVLPGDHPRRALRNVSSVVRPGGTVIIRGRVLDDTRLSPAIGVIQNLRLMNQYDGAAHTEQEHRDLLADAGFVGFERAALADGTSIVVAKKPV